MSEACDWFEKFRDHRWAIDLRARERKVACLSCGAVWLDTLAEEARA